MSKISSGEMPAYGAAGDVAHRVGAGLARGQAGGADDAHDFGGVVQVDEVELEVLARGDVAAVQAGVLLADLRQGVHLVRGHAAVGQLDAHHLVVFLALAVDAAREAVELEGRVGPRRRCGTSWRAPRTRRSRRSRYGR